MARIEIGEYLASDSHVCGGRLIFIGSRIKLADVLELADDRYSPEEISKQCRGIITPEAVIEALKLVRQGFLKEMSVRRKRAA